MKVVTVTLNPALDLTVRVDGFRAGEVNRGRELRWDAGGKGVNVASFLAAAGVAVTATGLLGDANPERFEALFRARGIADAFVRVPGETRVGIKIVDEGAQETTDVNLPGLVPSPADVAELRARIVALTANHEVFVLSGSVPPGIAPAVYADLTRELRAAGRVVVVDTSGPPLVAALAAAPTLVKPNVEELGTALGRPLRAEAEVLAAARALVAGGTALVTVSMGARGALFVAADEAVRAVPPKVTAKSSVGAGDAMVAGLVAARAAGLPLPEAARRATAFSIAAITRTGRSLPARADLDALARRVTVDILPR